METPAPALELNPTALPRGAQVGAWRVHGIRGRGTYGTVYAAVKHGHAEPAALKLAIYAGDPRFEREAELLARIRHPSVPRLLDAGAWSSPKGGTHPFVVMEWVEGEPLYEWAARRNPSSRQVLALLAQGAGALQATHEVSGVHRDVKGDNMLVRPGDGRLFLTDFGTGYFAGATRQTPLHVLLGTPNYLSPERWDAFRRAGPDATATVPGLPWDDVFALGVTAYRLVTDTYPPFTSPYFDQGRCWSPGGTGPRPPRELNPRVDPQLNALIMRMLSARPEERGTARELKEAMERGVAYAGPTADAALFEWETRKRSEWTEEERAEAEQLGHRPRRRNRGRVLKTEQANAVEQVPSKQVRARSWLTWLAASMALGLWPEETGPHITGAQLQGPSGASDARREAVSLGDAALTPPTESAKAPGEERITQQALPEEPLPGQLKPDAKGRCPGEQIAINGGCWAKVGAGPEYCPENMYMYKGGCYLPMFTRGRVPTSAPHER
jgi:serine/threonine protein kinase